MKHLKIENIIEKRFEKIETAFNNVRLQFNNDDIRVFRVKIKKLEAFLRLMNHAKDHGHSVKLPQKISKIYHIYGAIRTLQLQQDHIHKTLKGQTTDLPETYLKLIAAKILQHVSKINQYADGTGPFKKEEERLLKVLPKHFNREDILQFVHSAGDSADKLLSPAFPVDKSFHEVRKLLKELLYISPYIEMEMSDISPFILLSSYDDVDEFTSLLGYFHDFDTALTCLHTLVPIFEIDEKEKEILRSVECLWIKEKEAYRKKIYDEIKKITIAGRKAESLMLL